MPCKFLEDNEPGVKNYKRFRVQNKVIQNNILAYVSHVSVILRTTS